MPFSYNMIGFGGLGALTFALLLLWGLFWKGLGLWHSARRGQSWWFVAILLLNLFGLLEIIYLFAILKLSPKNLFTAGTSEKRVGEKESAE
ncbi:MAG: DUF5652 family protein [Patescibacteria group bacterium]